MRIVYIQQQYGEWLNENCFASARGFERMGYTVKPFNMNELESISLSKEKIVHGGIQTVRKCFDILGVKQPEIHHPHDHLLEYTKRSFTETTLGEVRNRYNEYPYFVKPLEDHKLFTGFVVENNFLGLMRLRHLSDDVKILMSEAVNFISEYRCFVLNKELVGCKNYCGDFTVLPDFKVVQDCITNYRAQPVAYSIDFAVTDEGETQLIEINDSFALGTYGLNNIIYCKMIMARWDEIMGNKWI